MLEALIRVSLFVAMIAFAAWFWTTLFSWVF
jgi:hypothetical protein